MKNKIVRVVVVLLSLILLVCPLFSFGASAYSNPQYANFTVTVSNPNNISFSSMPLLSGISVQTLQAEMNVITNWSMPSVIVEITTLENGDRLFIVNGENNSFVGSDIDDGYYLLTLSVMADTTYSIVPDSSHSQINITGSGTSVAYAYSDTGVAEPIVQYDIFVLDSSSYYPLIFDEPNLLVDGLIGNFTVLLFDLDIPNSGGGTSTECPTLQEQIEDYNGTWAEFQGMMSTNSTLYENFLEQKRNAYNDGIDVGQQDIINSINADNDFLSLMDTFLNYGMNNTRSVIENHMDIVYQNGIARGNEDGFNDGYNKGYNKGTSEVFGETLLGETFNAPLEALNQWVLFETPGGIEVTMGGLFTAVIALAVLIIFLKMFAGG